MNSAPDEWRTVLSLRARPLRAVWACCCALALWMALAACRGPQPEQPGSETRIQALETKVEALTRQLEQERGTDPAQALAALAANSAFDIECPAPWQTLGAMGEAIWTCRASQPSAAGLWPNCNVTLATTEPDVSPKQYFETSLAGHPQLKAARRIAARDTSLGIVPAFESVYEHDLLGKPLRVLSTLGVLSDRAYAVSCSAAPADFATHEVLFRRITKSFKVKL